MMHQYVRTMIHTNNDSIYTDMNYRDLSSLSHHENHLNSLDSRGYVGAVDLSSNGLSHDANLMNTLTMNNLNQHLNDLDYQNSIDMQQLLPIIANDHPEDIMTSDGMDLYSHYHHMQLPRDNIQSHFINMHNQHMAYLSNMHHPHNMDMPQHLVTTPANVTNDEKNNNENKADTGKGRRLRRSSKIITPEMKMILLEKNRDAQRRYRQSLSDEKRIQTLEKNRAAHKRYRESLSPEAQALCREKNKEAQRKRRLQQSNESKLQSQEKNKQSQKKRRIILNPQSVGNHLGKRGKKQISSSSSDDSYSDNTTYKESLHIIQKIDQIASIPHSYSIGLDDVNPNGNNDDHGNFHIEPESFNGMTAVEGIQPYYIYS